MADTEETPAQRQARLRRQKREAKINSTASERLDQITRLSGRTPESMRDESPMSIQRTATPPQNASSQPFSGPPPAAPFNADAATPEQVQMQQEYLRTLLRGPPPDANAQQPGAEPGEEDPMMQMLSSMMAGMNGEGDPNAPGGLPFSPDELASKTGLPSFVTNMIFGAQKAPPTPAELKTLRLWRALHVVLAVVSGLYMLFAIGRSTETYGADPPAPATFQNPFLVFMMGEILLQSARVVTGGPAGKRGPGLWLQMAKEFAGDGAIIVFMLGLTRWWHGFT